VSGYEPDDMTAKVRAALAARSTPGAMFVRRWRKKFRP
jgi:hypothetical protein